VFPRRLRIALAVLLGVSVTMIILGLRGGSGPMSGIYSAGSGVLGGIERVVATIFAPVTGFADFWTNTRDQKARIDALEKENGELQVEVKRLADDRARAEALDSMLKVAGLGRYRVVPAEVIAVGPAQEFAWTATIDVGSNDGIAIDMTVICGRGLVGRVSAVTRSTATVVLLTDASASVGARVAGSEEIGILSGTGKPDELTYQLLDPLATLDKGSALVTFGSRDDKPFVPGVPIGEVLSVSGTAGQLSRVATVRPFADVTALSIVGVVVRPPRTDPRDSVLPAVPNIRTEVVIPTPSASASTDGAAGLGTATEAPSEVAGSTTGPTVSP